MASGGSQSKANVSGGTRNHCTAVPNVSGGTRNHCTAVPKICSMTLWRPVFGHTVGCILLGTNNHWRRAFRKADVNFEIKYVMYHRLFSEELTLSGLFSDYQKN